VLPPAVRTVWCSCPACVCWSGLPVLCCWSQGMQVGGLQRTQRWSVSEGRHRLPLHAARPPVWLVCEVFFTRDREHLRGWFTQRQERVKLWLFSATMELPQAPGPQLRAVLFQTVLMTSTCGTLVCAARERSLCSDHLGAGVHPPALAAGLQARCSVICVSNAGQAVCTTHCL